MIASSRATRLASLALLSATLAGSVALARAQEAPSPGGTVPSVLGLSLSEPSGFSRTSAARRSSIYTSRIRAEVTATDAPTRLSIADGEATAARRRGHLVRGASILPAPLRAAASGGAYKSLDARVAAPLKRWREPVARARATIRLRQAVRGAATPRNYHKLLLVTITAAGP